MPHLADLKAATTLAQVAALLGVKPGMLSFLLYKENKLVLYTNFTIPKKHGGVRDICAPNQNLKLIQHRLSKILQGCEDEIRKAHGHFAEGGPAGVSHGFKKNHSIITNAREHVGRRFVFNSDLKNFFGELNFGRVRGFFIKDKNFLLDKTTATIIAQIACHDNKLPQGSPCSPVISNLIGHALDIVLVGLAKSSGCTYSRYADDLTFSTNKKSFPTQIAYRDPASDHDWKPGKHLVSLISKSGFELNSSKTRMQYADSRQEVTGLVVNKKINVPSTYRYTARAMAERMFNTGQFEFIGKKQSATGELEELKTLGQANQLIGMLSYIDQVDVFNQELCLANNVIPTDTHGRVKLFRKVLYFDNFYSPSMPVLVCEGKTDNVYIKHAVKSLAANYPSMISGGAKPVLKIRLFKYSERRTTKITQIVGGVGGLCHLIKNYYEDVDVVFKAPPPKYPVIILIDNDAGADSVYGAIAGITKTKKPAGHKPFIHVFANLYVVPTPFANGGGQTMIEDFFDAKTLATVLNGKTFDPGKDADNEKNYSKAAFARDVIAKNASSVDFSGFKAILDRVQNAIADYAVKTSLIKIS